jgi:hypothetical protein
MREFLAGAYGAISAILRGESVEKSRRRENFIIFLG